MCGRFVLSTPADAIAEEFSALLGGLALRPRYNIAPMQDIVAVRNLDGRRTLSLLRWGLIPFWAKDPKIAARMINARSETAAAKPAFRDALRKRRCIVPASGFYEWKKEGSRNQPWYFHTGARSGARAPSLAIAAVWESWRAPHKRDERDQKDEHVETCCLLTTAANRVCSPVHDRMPVLLDAAAVERWLDPSTTDAATLGDLLVPAAESALVCHPVSIAVGSVRNDDARNIEDATKSQEDAAEPLRDLPF